MRKVSRIGELPEVTRYTKYYEHDGMSALTRIAPWCWQ